MNLKRRFLTACAAFAALAWLGTAQADNWPDKPIRFVVPYTPGGGTDTLSRHITEKITQDTKWAFVIDNKPGGGGNIGTAIVAKARPTATPSAWAPPTSPSIRRRCPNNAVRPVQGHRAGGPGGRAADGDGGAHRFALAEPG